MVTNLKVNCYFLIALHQPIYSSNLGAPLKDILVEKKVDYKVAFASIAQDTGEGPWPVNSY